MTTRLNERLAQVATDSQPVVILQIDAEFLSKQPWRIEGIPVNPQRPVCTRQTLFATQFKLVQLMREPSNFLLD